MESSRGGRDVSLPSVAKTRCTSEASMDFVLRTLLLVGFRVVCLLQSGPAVSAQRPPPSPAGSGQPLPPSYRIGVDDVLAVSVWDNKELDETAFVRPDGKISLPLIGEIQAAGLTVTELASQLSE